MKTTHSAHHRRRRSSRPRRARTDRGSESVEMAILLPIGILVLALIVVGARIALAGDRISGVAGIAARDASIARSPGQAQSIATSSAMSTLSTDDVHCMNVRVNVDTSGFDALPGTGASITVNVWCTVDLSDIGVAGMPGSKTLHDVATSPLDPARDVGMSEMLGRFGVSLRAGRHAVAAGDPGRPRPAAVRTADGGAP